GVKPSRLDAKITAGAHFLRIGARPSLANDEGFVSSVTFSPTLGHWIGLGLLSGGPKRIGERVRAHDPLSGGDVEVEVEVVNPVFYDPDGKRLRD
ncbi:MAG: hypothetical protein KGJ72_14885, partial [Gammaproteobacteria bacterium]|nr:hypothetical protein [Gammaproteobacteria bacterium]